MILRLKVNRTKSGFEPAKVFSIDSFVDQEKLTPLLSELYDAIRRGVYDENIHNNTLHILLGADYEYMGVFIPQNNNTKDEIVTYLSNITETPLDLIYSKKRKREVVRIRNIAWAAMARYTPLTYQSMAQEFGMDHSTVTIALRRALKKYFYPPDDIALFCMNRIAAKFNDPDFVDICKAGDFSKRKFSTIKR